MKKFKILFSTLLLFAVAVTALQAQTARLQVIHNAADPAAAVVDVYLNGGLLLDDFAFRTATEFIDAPAGAPFSVGVAPGNSSSAADTLKNFDVTLAEGETYVAFANGVLDPTSFAANPEGRSTAFTLFVQALGQEAAADPSLVEFFALHGATDAPAVDVIARNVATLVDDAAYGDITGYLGVPPASYLLDVTPGSDNSILVATFEADLSGLAGGAAAVFASGFLTPASNNNGPAFGLFAALPTGDVVEFPAVTTARLQVIHNAADPAAAAVDVYLDGGLLLDDFAFRTATPFIDAPANVPFDVGVAAGNSSSANDTLKNFNVTLTPGETYVAFANGVLDPTMFGANPDGRSTAFTLFVQAQGQEAAKDPALVEFFALHGATDAPTVDVIARNVATLVDDAAYGDITPYIGVPPAIYLLDVTPGGDNNTVVATFEADLRTLQGGAAAVFASGFLTPDDDKDGPAFGLFAALPTGDVVAFPAATGARLQVIHNSGDPAAKFVDVYLNGGLLLDDFEYRTATPFIDAPADTLLEIGVAPGNSSSVDDVIATFGVTLEVGEKYVAIATGVLDPSQFRVNPDGEDTGFTLLVQAMARESGTGQNVDFFVSHGTTDAPTIDVVVQDGPTLLQGLTYGDFSGYVSVPAEFYIIYLSRTDDGRPVIAFDVDLTSIPGQSAVVVASGFRRDTRNQGGEFWALLGVLPDGTVINFPDPPITSIDDAAAAPMTYELAQNFPNPFNPETAIQFAIPNAENVSVKIFDILGREVATLVNERMNAGNYTLRFNANGLASGAYFYRIEAGDFVAIRKMMLLK